MTPQEEKKLDKAAEVEGSDQLTTAVRQKKQLEDLKNHPGWGMLEKFIREQVHNRTEVIVLTPVVEEKLAEQNFMRGETAFGKLILAQVEAWLSEANDVIEMFNQTKEHTDVDPGDE